MAKKKKAVARSLAELSVGDKVSVRTVDDGKKRPAFCGYPTPSEGWPGTVLEVDKKRKEVVILFDQDAPDGEGDLYEVAGRMAPKGADGLRSFYDANDHNWLYEILG